MDKNSTVYTLGFAAAITIVCAVLLGFAATKLKDQQDKNADVDKKSKILLAIGEFDPDNPIPADDVLKFFSKEGKDGKYVVKFAVDHFGKEVEGLSDLQLQELDLEKQIKEFPGELKDAELDKVQGLTLEEAKEKFGESEPELVEKYEKHLEVVSKRKYPIYAYYDSKEAYDSKKPTNYIVPIYGYGLWSNCYGVVALDNTGQTVKNLVYYKHGETPGLGGEIEKEYFSKRFENKKVYNDNGIVSLTTTKGETDENSVAAISGATFTMDGVNNMLKKFLTIYGVYISKQAGGSE